MAPRSDDDIPTYRLVVIGDGGVGKSAITIQFFQKKFIEYYDPTIEEQYIQHTEVDGEWCVLDVLDTAGQDVYAAMREHYMRTGNGFLLVYSVTDPRSFEKVKDLHAQVLRVKDREEFPILLVANKADLVHLRKISETDGKALAESLNISYMETSAKDPPLNIEDCFHELVRIVRRNPIEETRHPLEMTPSSDKKKCCEKCCVIV